MRKFLERIVRLVERAQPEMEIATSLEQALARASVKVAEDGDRFKFNTGVAALMILVNELEAAPSVPVTAIKSLLVMLAPFAPHLAEHLWEKVGGEGSVHAASWPTFSQVAAALKEVVVQVGGKRRASILLAVDALEADAVAA